MLDVEATALYPEEYILVRMDNMIGQMCTVLFVGDNEKELMGVVDKLENKNLCGVIGGDSLQNTLGGIFLDA
jgi:hypothetical protein